MTTQEIKEYYVSTEQREIRTDLEHAVSMVGTPKIAIDCGCGAGSDIAYLLEHEFKVYGFDIEEESILRCKKRFKHNNNVYLSKNSFESFDYPKASLVVADASLFFCCKQAFDDIWLKIERALFSGGIFCGSFLGPEDTMAGLDYDKSAWWPNVLVLYEKQVREKFDNFQIIRFTEHKTSGLTPQGIPHEWHIFSVIAKKN